MFTVALVVLGLCGVDAFTLFPVATWPQASRTRLSHSKRRAAVSAQTGKDVLFEDYSRLELMKGIDKVANAVKVTLGPKGRNVVLEKEFGLPEVVNDGVTIARGIKLEDPVQNVGAQLVVEVASKTDFKAGDGTTTSTVLAQAMVREGLKYVTSGANAVAMQRGIDKASAEVVRHIKELATPITENSQVQSIATISTGSEAMGEVMAEAKAKVGVFGTVTIEDGQATTDQIAFAEGMEIESGMLNPQFIKQMETSSTTFTDAFVLCTDKKVERMSEILPACEVALKARKPLLIFCADLTGEGLTSLLLNVNRDVLDVLVVKPPAVGEVRRAYIEDICTVTGATFIDTTVLGMKLENTQAEQLGTVARVFSTESLTTIVAPEGTKDAITKQLETFKKLSESADDERVAKQAKARMTKLSGQVARIMVGAATEAELKDKNLRYEDALNAVRCAVEDGVVPGGGAALAYCMRFKDEIMEQMNGEDEKLGAEIVFKAMKYPAVQIASNAGVQGEVVYEKLLDQEWGYGFNAATLQYENLLESGVLDPAAVTCWALSNAGSIAALILTTEAVVTEVGGEDEGYGDAMGASLGGMGMGGLTGGMGNVDPSMMA